MMRFVFLVNDATEMKATQTTTMLIAEAARQGFEVYVSGVGELSYETDGIPTAWARKLGSQVYSSNEILVQIIADTQLQKVKLTDCDVLMLRTNPARDSGRQWAHPMALQFAAQCKEQGILVVNDPAGLFKASNKLYLLEMPAHARPKTMVSQHPNEIKTFIETLNASAVLKPLQGTRGNDVFFVSTEQDNNLNQIIEVILRQSAVMVQEFIPEAKAGDTRVVVFNGKILRVNGKAAAVRRVPDKGELRSNIHTGGKAQLAVLSDNIEEVVNLIGPKLVKDGLFLVGLDFIGGKIIEINVFSTGGLRDAQRFNGVHFAEQIIKEIASLA